MSAAKSAKNTATVKVKLVKSLIKCTQVQKQNVKGLGLKKIGDTKEVQNTPCNRGMIKKVIHLLQVGG